MLDRIGVLARISVLALHRMCLCYYVLGFAAHSTILGVDCDSEDDCCFDDDNHYDFLGYGIDFEECADELCD